MAIDVLIVAVLGLAAVAWELWWFLGPRPAAIAQPERGGVQDVTITVRDGYEPNTIPVEAGRPVRLHFVREETAPCSERVVFPTLNLERDLPAFATTIVEFTPTQPGDYPFRCAKDVLRGRVVAQVGREAARVNLGRGHTKHG
jgi:plastocyanin domain-containing protein